MTESKKPKATKPSIKKKPVDEFDFSEFTGDQTRIPADIQKELDEKGLAARWVSLGKIRQYGGRHPKGWEPYKLDNVGKSEDELSLFGTGAHGYFQRGDLVLAVKTKENHRRHKNYLNYEAKTNSVKEMMKRSKKQFKDEIRQQGLSDSIKVVDGYDE